jgi:hypothetical protein
VRQGVGDIEDDSKQNVDIFQFIPSAVLFSTSVTSKLGEEIKQGIGFKVSGLIEKSCDLYSI